MRCVFHAMAGFLGRVDRETRCAFWAEEPVDHGSSARVADLASPEHCDAGAASLTTIGTGDAPKEGALFLITGQV
jgi:hypothetical protein